MASRSRLPAGGRGRSCMPRHTEPQPLWRCPPGGTPPFWVACHASGAHWRDGLKAEQTADIEARFSNGTVEIMAALLPRFRSPDHRAAFHHLLRCLAVAAMAYPSLHPRLPDLSPSEAALRRLIKPAHRLNAQIAALDERAALLLSTRLKAPMPERATRDLISRLMRDLAILTETARARPGVKRSRAELRSLIDGLADVYEYVTGQHPPQTRDSGSFQQSGPFAELVRAVTAQLPQPFRGPADASIRSVLEARVRLRKDEMPPPESP